jgi:GNAT superfamily N-acetyltransferase
METSARDRRSVVEIRRVTADDWRRVRDLRLAALRDPDTAIAFLDTYERAAARPDEFWRQRAAGSAASAAGGARGGSAAQLVAVVDGEWVGTVTVLVQEAGDTDHLGLEVAERRATLVGVYLDAAHRGSGIIAQLIEAATAYTAEQGLAELTLDVHRDNARAQAAYRRSGFRPTGREFTGPIGPELEMARPV